MKQIEEVEDTALLRVLEDINEASDEVAQNRAIDRYLKLSIAIGIKNGEFNPAAYTAFYDTVMQNNKK